MVITGTVFAAFASTHVMDVKFSNNFKKLQGDSPAVRFSEYVGKSLGGSVSPGVIAVKDVEEARRVEEIIKMEVDNPSGQFKRSLSLATMVPDPKQVPERTKLLSTIRGRLTDLDLGEFNKEDRERIEELIDATKTPAWKAEQLPLVFRRLFTTIDEDLTFVLIWPRYNMNWDYNIISWAKALDGLEVDLKTAGLHASLLDQNRVVARVVTKMVSDGPLVMGLAILAVIILLFLDFRSARRVVPVGLTLIIGFLWTMGIMYLFKMNLNVFNIAILPTILGLGIDNAVHMAHRYHLEGRGSMAKVVRTTGSAALLASLTTTIGFGSTILAHHAGVRSMGELALLGFTCAFVASTVFFPALIRAFEGHNREEQYGGKLSDEPPRANRVVPSSGSSRNQPPTEMTARGMDS